MLDFPPRLNRRRHLFLFLPLALLLLGGCGGRRSDDGRKILHFGNGTEVQDLDPQVVTGVPENKVINALFEGLVAEDDTGSGTAPGVAERWENSEDGREWTFHLRRDARWSNGDPLTAHDFVRSYQRILTPSLGAEYAYKLFHVVGAEDFNAGRLTDFSQVGVKAIDDHTLHFALRHRTPFLIEALKHYSWFPVHVPTVERFGGLARKGTAWTRSENLVGNGPFTLTSWTPNKRIIVSRSPTYWDRERVKLEEIHFYPIDSIETEERMFRTGQLHLSNELPLSKIPIYRRDQPEVYRQDPYYGVYFYRLNTRRPPLDDVRVRRALALAIDRESLVTNVTRGGQQPAYNFCPPSEEFQSRARIEGDLETARQLLAEAGFPGGRGFPRLEILYNTSESHRVIAEAIQQMWRTNLGINIGLLNQEWKVYLDSQDEGQYDIARAGWIADYTDPNTFMDMWVTDGGNNDTGFSHPEYDRLLATSLETETNEQRLEVYQQLEEILAREVPIIPIYFYTRVYAISPKVTGWPPNALDNRAWKYVDLQD
jgi:oligopeptide transport system substrate-binding protein